MKRSGSILKREYDEYDEYDLPPLSNQEHGEAHAKLVAREKAAAEAAEAERLAVHDEASNVHASSDQTDDEYEETEDAARDQQLLDEDDGFAPNDEQVEAEEIDRLLGNPVEPETLETPESPELDEATRLQRKQLRLEAEKRHANIARYTAVNLGIDVLDPDHIGPYDFDAHRHIAFFKEDFCETVSVRVAQALSFKTYPLPNGSQFNAQSWVRLRQLGVDEIWKIVDTHMSKRLKEVLGRRKFGRQEVLDLPKLTMEDQFRRGLYVDHVQHQTKGDKLYTGSATSELGFAGRWFQYDHMKAGAGLNNPERARLHLSAGLEQHATMHLRPLVFLDDLDRSLILLIEGLMMDFIGTIDRSATRPISFNLGGNGNYVLHNPEILETSKQAFPSQRQPMEFEGLNSVSALKQMSVCKLPRSGCPLGGYNCKEKASLVIVDGVPKVVCRHCATSWNQMISKGKVASDNTGDWDKYVAKRKAAKHPFAQSAEVVAAQIVSPYVCSDCGRDFKSQHMKDKHTCKLCEHCKHVYGGSVAEFQVHEANCNGVFKAGPQRKRVDKYSCPLCMEPFTMPDSLKAHEENGRCLAVEANRKPAGEFNCPVCRAPFSLKASLVRHQKSRCKGARVLPR
jgi:hypothetical protein